jgi:hypothetical protein
MLASYYKAMAEFDAGKMSQTVSRALGLKDSDIPNLGPMEKHAKAIEFADWTTERSQAMAIPEMQSSLARSPKVIDQMFTALASQQNAMYQMLKRTTREFHRTETPEARSNMIKAYIDVLIINAMFMVGIDRLRDFVYGRDSQPLWAAAADKTAGIVMFLREFTTAAISHIEKGHRGYDVSYPAVRWTQTVSKGLSDLNTYVTTDNMAVKEEAMEGVANSIMETLALLSGYPYSTPIRTIKGVLGLNEPPPDKNEEDFMEELFGY